MAPQDRPAALAGLRRIAHEYGWLAAAGGLALVVLLCSARFVAGTGLTWNSAAPVAVTSADVAGPEMPATTTPPTTAGTPTAAPPSASPSPPKPAPSRTTRKPAPERTATTTRPAPSTQPAPSTPTLLGPNDDDGRWRMTDRYCKRMGQEWYSQPGQRGDGNWYCVAWNRTPARVDMDTACRITYGTGAFAQASNSRDPQSWRCYRS
ncbi:hypothetical protein WEI85_21765 [Actinomycetes bacterium KLBMP 9797]